MFKLEGGIREAFPLWCRPGMRQAGSDRFHGGIMVRSVLLRRLCVLPSCQRDAALRGKCKVPTLRCPDAQIIGHWA